MGGVLGDGGPVESLDIGLDVGEGEVGGLAVAEREVGLGTGAETVLDGLMAVMTCWWLVRTITRRIITTIERKTIVTIRTPTSGCSFLSVAPWPEGSTIVLSACLSS